VPQRVVRAAQHKTPEGAVRDSIVVNKEAVADALRHMLRAAGISVTGAVTAVSGPTVVVRHIKLPRMTEAALRKSVRYEAAKYITANVEDSAIAFEILAPAPKGHPGSESEEQMSVMLVAAPKEMVESRTEAVEMAGLEAVAVDTEAFALQRALVDCNIHHYNDGQMRALVEIGAAHTEVSILNGTSFALTRSIPIAGDSFTGVLKNQLHCDTAEAERIKAEADMALLLTQGTPGADDPEALEAPRLLQPMLDELLREIRRSIHYYQSQLPESSAKATLAEIALSGGTAQLRGLPHYMRARLGTEVAIGNAFANPLFQTPGEASGFFEEQHPRLSIGLGLAIKELMPSARAAHA
jgi:type IV pilus assembly protein PilM